MTHHTALQPIQRDLQVDAVGDLFAISFGDYAADSLAFLFGWDPVADREVYIRSGRRADLEIAAAKAKAEGRDYFVLPRNESAQAFIYKRHASEVRCTLERRCEGPQQVQQALGEMADVFEQLRRERRSVDAFIVMPKGRNGDAPPIEKNLDGQYWTSKSGATGALAVFEHRHPEVQGTLAVHPARIDYVASAQAQAVGESVADAEGAEPSGLNVLSLKRAQG